MESIKLFLKNLADYVSRMTASQVMMLFGVIAGIIVGAVLVVGWLDDVTYSRLYSDLEESEAGEVIAYLADNKVPYQLSQGGRTIEIPASEVYRLRISLASQGLPRSGSMGYSIFDESNLGMTDFLQNLNFRRALEGELTRTIMQLHEVRAARVHIVMPKERLFKKDQKPATASIVVKLRGDGLSSAQVSGITHLVAASVEGLKTENIILVDYNGNLLSSQQGNDHLVGLSASQLGMRKQVEAYLQDKAQSMLDGVLGSGKSIVRVTADLNFQQVERTSENYDPNAPSIRSEERVKRTTSVSDKGAEAEESSEEDISETTITNYELNKTVEHIINAVGTIERLSVAVMVDGVYEPVENADGVIEDIYQPRSQQDLDRLASIVRNAIGFDQQRNDQMEIVNFSFDRQNLEGDRLALDQMYEREFYLDIGKKVGYVVLCLFLLLYVKKKATKLFAALGKLAPPPPPPQRAAEMTAAAQSVEDEEAQPIVMEKRKPKLIDQMQETAKEQPDEIAKVIKTMMVD